jgi:uncharacterized protein
MQTAILWHLADPFFGTERCILTQEEGDDTISLDGAVLHTADGHLWDTNYRVIADLQWRTREMIVHMAAINVERSVQLTADGEGHWQLDDTPYPALDGCIDIDLGITPSTNTLPIRRLGLQPGQSAEVVAAWVRFPALTIERLPQRYTCLASDRYRYESPNFTALLTVDAHGLVLDYEGLWHAVASEKG